MIALHEAIQRIRQDTEIEATTKHMEWFDTAIIPVLKEYAEQTSSILDIERDREMLIQATLRNACGLDISSDSRCLYMVIMSTVHPVSYTHLDCCLWPDSDNPEVCL